jgi:hypothetical protein
MRSWCRSLLHAVMLASVCPLLAAGAVSAADAVLLSSTAPGYAPGMVVAARDRLTVPEGASATFVFQSGEILRVRGPFEGTLRPVDTQGGRRDSIAGLAETLRFQGIDAAVVGGSRSLDLRPRRRAADVDLVVDPQRSATYCLDKSTAVWIGRPDEGGSRIKLRRRGSSREIAWPSGAARVEWPTDVLVEDGDRFEIVDDAGSARATATFRILDEQSSSESARVAQAALMGCQDQVSASLRDLAQAVSPPELWLATDRGRKPTYRPGEPMQLMIQSNGDGFLYCVQRRADDTVRSIFPAGAVDGARLRSHETLSIPGRRRAGQVTTGPRGQENVACYLADRDIAAELPHALVSEANARLPEALANRIDAVFDSIGGTRVLKASLAVQVE